MQNVLKKLRNYEILNEDAIAEICRQATDQMIAEPNICRVSSNVVVVGDIHGQFSDLLHIFETHGTPETTNYVFLGDYVDRGAYSVECILYLLAFKSLYPQNLVLLRGNHEQRIINKTYGFYDEVFKKYENSSVWSMINKVFDHLSIGCIVNGKYFCVHGGISPRVSISKLERIDRFEKLTEQSLINDIIWSDPFYKLGSSPNPRGNGVLFGEDVLKQFLMLNNLDMLVRSHQLAIEGFKWDFDNLCLTVWSAPEYMGKFSNPASVLLIIQGQTITSQNIKVFHRTKPFVTAR